MYAFLTGGGEVCFFGGDVLKLRDDWQMYKPTVIPIVPRLLNKIYGLIQTNFGALTGLKKTLANKAVDAKLHYLHQDASTTHFFWDAVIFKKTKAIFGGRCRMMVTGSAPVASDVLDFIKIAACCPILEGYGQTETMGASFVTDSKDPKSGHVGGPCTQVQFKLVDCPEMNYTHMDKDKDGNPYPRGEVMIKSNGNMVAYYKNEKATQETLTNDGFIATGDIATILANGSVKLFDRRKNLFKLAQGEYVAPEKIENALVSCPGVMEVWSYGDPSRSYMVGVVVPDP